MAFFKGFSTIDKGRAPFVLVDRELIKRDLLNEFYTRRGERVMRPTFGSRIWEMLMNPMDEFTENEVRNDIKNIVQKDPRVNLLDIKIEILEHTIRADIILEYVSLGDSDILYLNFQNERGIA